jgi:hypothetical protein
MSEGRRLPKTMNQREAKRLLEEHGWVETRGGKHVVKMTKPGHRPITPPRQGQRRLRARADSGDTPPSRAEGRR